MKVFVTGATGVLGRRAVPLLLQAGHSVSAVARTAPKADEVRRMGAVPVVVDMFDAAAIKDAVAGHDAVVNLATHIPPLTKAFLPGAWTENNRIRSVASGYLVDAALAAGARRFVQESITMIYTDGGSAWLDESSPFEKGAFSQPVTDAEGNTARFTAGGGTGVVLRFSMFYGEGAGHTVDQLRAARQGIAPVVGRGDGYQSMIHLDDAARAVVAALDAPAGTYNVTEDRPVTRTEQAAAIAAALGVAPGWPVPAALTKAGGAKAAPLTGSQRVSNRAFRDATGWAPEYPDAWSGWPQVVGASGGVGAPPATRGRRILVKASLVYLALQAASVGLWATFAPRSWYKDFPGGGRHWVSVDGPYNHHLVTDVGGLFLALLALTIVAAGSHSRALMRTAGVAWVVSALPHVLYHATHRGALGAGDFVVSVSGLALQVVLGVVCVVFAPASVAAPRAAAVSASVPVAA